MNTNGLSRRSFLKFAAGAMSVSALAACMPAAPQAGAGAQAGSEQKSAGIAGKTGVFWGLQYDPHVETYKRLAKMFKDINESIVYCLKAAVDAGELSASTDVREVASFLYSSWHGAILQSKVELSIKPLERFKRVLFSQILH